MHELRGAGLRRKLCRAPTKGSMRRGRPATGERLERACCLLFRKAVVPTAFRFLALALELSHGLLMVVWALGLPLLVWHRLALLSRAYVGFSLVFVAGSVISHLTLGECVLTMLARAAWNIPALLPKTSPSS